MKRLILSQKTGEFLTGDGTWSKDIRAARRFSSSGDVRSTIHELGLTNAALYFSFEDTRPSEWDFFLPQPDEMHPHFMN